MKKASLVKFGLVAMLSGAAIVPVNAGSTTAITLAHHGALDQAETLFGEEFKACVEVGDEFEVALYPAGQLGSAQEIVEQITLGAIDMTITDTAYLSNLVPELTAWMLPFIFSSWEQAEAAMNGEAGEITANLVDDGLDLRLLATFHGGFRDFMTIDKPLNSIEDFEGVKFRSPPIPVWVKMFEALKAIPVTVDWSEVYTALRSGLVEGFESTPEGFIITNSPEIGKYIIRTGHMYDLMMLVISNDTYDGLSDGQKTQLNECSNAMAERANPYKRAISETGYATLAEAGMEILEIDTNPIREVLSAAWPDMLDGIDADDLISAIGRAGQ